MLRLQFSPGLVFDAIANNEAVRFASWCIVPFYLHNVLVSLSSRLSKVSLAQCETSQYFQPVFLHFSRSRKKFRQFLALPRVFCVNPFPNEALKSFYRLFCTCLTLILIPRAIFSLFSPSGFHLVVRTAGTIDTFIFRPYPLIVKCCACKFLTMLSLADIFSDISDDGCTRPCFCKVDFSQIAMIPYEDKLRTGV